MWAELICGLIIYKLIRRFLYDDDIVDVESSDTDAIFLVANRYGAQYLNVLLIEVLLLNRGGKLKVYHQLFAWQENRLFRLAKFLICENLELKQQNMRLRVLCFPSFFPPTMFSASMGLIFFSLIVFYVLCRLERIYGGKVYVGLRIPDPDTGSRQNIDMVLVTNEYVSSVLSIYGP